jgi:GNAT superfamily N-acetyltransferase
MPDLTFHELASLHDPNLLPWLDLYELSFPTNEKVLVSNHLDLLKLKEQGRAEDHIFLAALKDGVFTGLARCQLVPALQLAILWYLATLASLRGQGLGAALYQEVVLRTARNGLKALVLEVEIPENQPDPSLQALAVRRIQFYRRLGAFRLSGIHYLQYVGEHQPPTPMHILVHQLQPLNAGAAFDLFQQFVGNAITRTGPLAFDL